VISPDLAIISVLTDGRIVSHQTSDWDFKYHLQIVFKQNWKTTDLIKNMDIVWTQCFVAGIWISFIKTWEHRELLLTKVLVHRLEDFYEHASVLIEDLLTLTVLW